MIRNIFEYPKLNLIHVLGKWLIYEIIDFSEWAFSEKFADLGYDFKFLKSSKGNIGKVY